MELKGKALFNLLRISRQEDPSIRAEPWQVEDLRNLSIEELLSRLKQIKPGIIANPLNRPFYPTSFANCEAFDTTG